MRQTKSYAKYETAFAKWPDSKCPGIFWAYESERDWVGVAQFRIRRVIEKRLATGPIPEPKTRCCVLKVTLLFFFLTEAKEFASCDSLKKDLQTQQLKKFLSWRVYDIGFLFG